MSIKISSANPIPDSFDRINQSPDYKEEQLDPSLLAQAEQEFRCALDAIEFADNKLKLKNVRTEDLSNNSLEKIDLGFSPVPDVSDAYSIENLRKLPIMERLLAHLAIIIPLLREIETTEKWLELDRMRILENHMNEEIGSNNLSGAITLFGNLGAAAISIFAGQGGGQIASTLVGAADTLNRSNMIYDQKEFQLSQSELDNIKRTLQQSESLRQRLRDEMQRFDQAFILRG